ncbi:hypothetical protein DITRI_Ditri06bG0094800 [Diplodiscus trichospermus]
MEKMGFGVKWRGWIMGCVSTVTLLVLVNGVPTRQFRMSRGLRQGCPLSSFLFNLVREVLSVHIHKAISLNFFKGASVGNDALPISHLQFIDDKIIFCKLTLEQISNVKSVLRCFQVALGSRINFHKSKLYGIDSAQQIIGEWASQIYCKADTLPTSYLGFPLGAKVNATSIWQPMVDKFHKMLSG